VGISDYQDLFDLQYADSDAERFAAYLSDSLGGEVKTENIILLRNSDATKQNLLKSFQLITQKMQKGDRFIFYFAGHSDYTEEQETAMYLFDSQLNQPLTQIEWGYISKVMENIKSKECDVIFFWDSMSSMNLSGNSMETINSTFSDVNHSSSIFYASKPNENAFEGPQYGGGLFTSVLLRGLYGEADIDEDSMVTAKELDVFAEQEVRQLSENMQSPIFYGDAWQTIANVHLRISNSIPLVLSYGEIELKNIEVDNSADSKPNFKLENPISCAGQAIVTKNDSTEITIKVNNKIEYFIVNSQRIVVGHEKIVKIQQPLINGLNSISIKAYNGLEVTEDSLLVYSTYTNNGIKMLITNKRKINHYALFIAIDDYKELTPLKNPVYDAREIALNLKQNYGFEIDTLMNPTKEQIQFKLREYAERLTPEDRKNRNDHLLIYFSGHGAKDEAFNNGYFAPKDANIKDEFFNSYISFEDLRSKINSLNYKHILVMMDACYSGLLDSDLSSENKASPMEEMPRNLKGFVEEKLNYETRRMITAGGAVQVSDGIKGKHSPFASNLLGSFRAGDPETLPLVTIEYILGNLQSNETVVHNAVFLSNDPGSNFLFFYQNEK
jgi:uncharacterized caspase-like protein